jgi:hypothetical protein
MGRAGFVKKLTNDNMGLRRLRLLGTEVRSVWEAELGEFTTVETANRRNNLVFGLDGSLQAQAALQLIKIMVEKTRAERRPQ